jgi:putative ABC transport system permease protein
VRRNLFHEVGKLILSVSGVGAALALILLLLGFRQGLYATLTAFADNIGADLIVAQDGVKGILSSDSAVPMAIHDESARQSGAEEAGHILLADIIFSQNEAKTPVLLVGYDPETTFGAPWELGDGRFLQADDEIMLDTWLAKRSNLQVGDRIEVLGESFSVVGLTRGTSSWMSPYIFITLPAAEQALALQGLVSFHLLRLPDSANTSRVIRSIENQIPGVQALTPGDIADADRRVMATVMDTPLNVMLAIGSVIGGAVMGLTSYTSIIDHKREYGVLKAIGAGGWWLNWLVVRETFFRAVSGFVLGAGFAFLAAEAIMTLWPQFNIVIQTKDLLLTAALALLMTFPAALLPMQRLKRIDPVEVFQA